ncbi:MULTISPECIES: LuxR family transcriptional regulator [unclassified Microbacterium]|uniref:LuxR family transcriptional regulator n=1 Tax=unclassified Microbacterium TaxID=2609290 RepID=UPI0012FACC17|nr:LuxR family transcriptional regulator [Microbacterium sp. MAH-37]MVQ42678.1 LuxR family transcriptional regulator [Microbacterium sp. MAH-37]
MTDAADGLSWTGLPAEDLALYQRLLAQGADAANAAPPQQVDRLVEAGFLSEGEPVAPGTALRTALHAQFAHAHRRLAELETASEGINRMVAELAASPGALVAHGMELVSGAEQIRRRADDLVDSARDEILVLNSPPYAQPEVEPEEDDPDGPPTAGGTKAGMAVARGVNVRNVFAKSGLDAPRRMAAITELAEWGMGVRVHPSVPTKMMIIDRTTVLMPPSAAADPLEHALVIRDGLLMNALLPLFEMLWETAVPLGAVPASGASDAGDAPPTVDERVLIALLASGLKDEAIARQLDVHVHTARRRINAVIDRLDATTRFQAGLQAARRGWLD